MVLEQVAQESWVGLEWEREWPVQGVGFSSSVVEVGGMEESFSVSWRRKVRCLVGFAGICRFIVLSSPGMGTGRWRVVVWEAWVTVRVLLVAWRQAVVSVLEGIVRVAWRERVRMFWRCSA